MTYQGIHEKITVLGIYEKAHFVPKKFKWQNRDYYISEITFAHDVKDGGTRKRMYSVIGNDVGTTLGLSKSENNVFRLEFDRDQEIWWLEEIWCE